MKKHFSNARVFLLTTFILWVGLSVIEILGYLRPVDTAFMEIGNALPEIEMVPIDGILIILIFAALPGIAVALWKSETAIMVTVLALLAYYWLAYLFYHAYGHPLPVVVVVVAATASLLRGFGYHPRIDIEWARKFGSFISYRRENGADIALLVSAELGNRGFPTFIDVKGLGASYFDRQLLQRIGENPNFVLILSPGALDHCNDTEDWLRREISQAIKSHRNIIPIIVPGFSFPKADTLPEEIAELPRHQAVTYSREYPSSTIDQLTHFLMQHHNG